MTGWECASSTILLWFGVAGASWARPVERRRVPIVPGHTVMPNRPHRERWPVARPVSSSPGSSMSCSTCRTDCLCQLSRSRVAAALAPAGSTASRRRSRARAARAGFFPCRSLVGPRLRPTASAQPPSQGSSDGCMTVTPQVPNLALRRRHSRDPSPSAATAPTSPSAASRHALPIISNTPLAHRGGQGGGGHL